MNNLKQLATQSLRAGLRAMPWVVSAGTLVFGSWFFGPLMPIASDSRLAAVGIGLILLRTCAAIAAVSAGSFALAGGLEGRALATAPLRRRRFAGLAALGATSMALGTFIVAGPFAGFSFAHSFAVVTAAGVVAALSAWSTWSLRRRGSHEAMHAAPPPLLDSSRATADWVVRDGGRVKTHATQSNHNDR